MSALESGQEVAKKSQSRRVLVEPDAELRDYLTNLELSNHSYRCAIINLNHIGDEFFRRYYFEIIANELCLLAKAYLGQVYRLDNRGLVLITASEHHTSVDRYIAVLQENLRGNSLFAGYLRDAQGHRFISFYHSNKQAQIIVRAACKVIFGDIPEDETVELPQSEKFCFCPLAMSVQDLAITERRLGSVDLSNVIDK
ncbi:MAG: hypothetical protein AAF352_06875, partial [Pseudomonadota bacterium]